MIWVRESSNAHTLSGELDITGYGGLQLIEVWISSDVSSVFTVYGSVDGTSWRRIEDLVLPFENRTDRHRGYHNAYQHIKVSTSTVGNHEIEIVAGA